MVWAAGQRLQNGKYIIEKILGEGGFGITYQARHTLLQQLMVIKTPNEKLKNDPEYPKYLKRFVEEGQRLEKLSEKQHPNIVRVRDLFEESGIYCLVMDFVAGESLFDLVRRRGALPANEAVEYVRQIGEALTVVHQAKLVHRDAHPGNIMVQQGGKAVLIDFGFAAEIFATTVSSKAFANLAFAPYEQMTQGYREPTVDIYSLAASLYYAVTGERPTPSCDRKLNNVRLIEPKQHANICDELNRAILKGMELEAKNRPQSMQELLKLLEVANRTVEVSLPSKKRRSIPWGWLTRVLLTLLTYLLTSVALGIFLARLAWAWAWAWAWPLGLTWVLASESDLVFLLVFASCLPLAWSWISASGSPWAWLLAWLGFVPLAWLLAWLGVVPLVWALDKLNQSFSNFHTFLIVLGTSWLGLGLGWFAYQIFPIFR